MKILILLFTKRLLLLFSVLLIGFSACGQNGSGRPLPLAIGDTILNTTSVTKYLSSTGGYSGANIQVVLVSQTGTPAGSVKLYGSVDGVTYLPLLNSASDTLAISASALSYIFKETPPLPAKFKIVAKGTGTQHTLVTIWYKQPFYQDQH
jgi:hypothetical protein